MIDPDLTVPERIAALIEAELAAAELGDDPILCRTAQAFRRVQRRPRAVTVNFSGGITQTCWSVTRGDGDYRVIYLPTAGYFSLCVESDFGPLDIGVHGPALGCFGSV
ncbi:hypothetical protein [Sulfitobacter sabulilitoris]|uniref:Uncharacterized protein n=1 Tax=Sulfitobacter sabulilitoris TaxID=2562655 RepID=A0A5S3PHA8_9RHOB|nr:hypothetical protein [Sulfitobacter sabulilitoris]TMM51144.1 hypothetical protein FDT80_14860 [Sulfitobacter sabulilitoris]